MGKKQQKRKHKDKEMESLLKKLETEGIPMSIEGIPSNRKEILHLCMVQEDGEEYLPDFIPGEDGRLSKVNYNRVRYR